MRFKKKKFGGLRPICTASPGVGVAGGFNLDKSKVNYPVGATIPGGSLSQYDEVTRLVTVLKSARVLDIDSDNAKKVTLESDEFLSPIFCVGDKVVKTVSGKFSEAPAISKITSDGNGYVIELSVAISGLAVGDALFEVIKGATDVVVLPIDAPQGLSIAAEPMGTVVSEFEASLDVTTDTKGGYFYLRRIPPIPDQFISGVCLKTNPNIQFTNSF
jgi:hypothetical protein